MVKNQEVLNFVETARKLCNPDKIEWVDGSSNEALKEKALATGEIIRLNEQLFPGCYLHRSALNDVARAEDKTFICTKTKEAAGPNNNWFEPDAMYEKLKSIYKDCMKGRTMYVIPFFMGPLDSPFSKIGVEITDSVYVVLSMNIMTRISPEVIKKLEETNDFVRCLHSTGTLDYENRFISHFPEDNTIWSVNSGYGGNALLGKKCFALRIASYQARYEGWLAEHMLIIGVEKPNGEVVYICGAFPSACGKTNLAMLIPPEYYKEKGYKIWCVGDDIAWLRIGEDGRLWAINPENGYFGVVPGTNTRTNSNAIEMMHKDTIFTNVVYDVDNNSVWWEGLEEAPPENALNWKGEKWDPKTSTEKGAHPNSRFTAPAKNNPCISPELDNPKGVPISAFLFGGRRAKTAPLVYESRDFAHGVFVASTMASETTAAQTGAVGITRIDSMAMKPFCGYNMADYFGHWLSMGQKLGDKAPKIFNVNWFRTDENGNFMWPGYGENMRVIDWVLRRCSGEVKAKESEIGMVPYEDDINLNGTDLESLGSLLSIDKELWKTEAANIREYFTSYGDALPKELWNQLETLESKLI